MSHETARRELLEESTVPVVPIDDPLSGRELGHMLPDGPPLDYTLGRRPWIVPQADAFDPITFLSAKRPAAIPSATRRAQLDALFAELPNNSTNRLVGADLNEPVVQLSDHAPIMLDVPTEGIIIRPKMS